jgi:hypothetical protein
VDVQIIIIFGPTDQKLWGNENFRRSLGKASAITNQHELTTSAQKGGQ